MSALSDDELRRLLRLRRHGSPLAPEERDELSRAVAARIREGGRPRTLIGLSLRYRVGALALIGILAVLAAGLAVRSPIPPVPGGAATLPTERPTTHPGATMRPIASLPPYSAAPDAVSGAAVCARVAYANCLEVVGLARDVAPALLTANTILVTDMPCADEVTFYCTSPYLVVVVPPHWKSASSFDVVTLRPGLEGWTSGGPREGAMPDGFDTLLPGGWTRVEQYVADKLLIRFHASARVNLDAFTRNHGLRWLADEHPGWLDVRITDGTDAAVKRREVLTDPLVCAVEIVWLSGQSVGTERAAEDCFPHEPGPTAMPTAVDGQPVMRGDAIAAHVATATDDAPFLIGGLIDFFGIADCYVPPDFPDTPLLRPCGGWPSMQSIPLVTDDWHPTPSQRYVLRVHVHDSRAADCPRAYREQCERAVVVEEVVWQPGG